MHQLNIAHRDIKPDNILVNILTGKVKLADFGNAKIIKNSNNHVHVCNIKFRAPELLLGCTNYDTKIDIFSLGCTFF